MLKRIYLAGWTGEFEYRKYCIDNHSDKFEFWDPIGNTDGKILEEAGIDIKEVPDKKDLINPKFYKPIVEGDKTEIRCCNYVFAYMQKATVGTVMEVIYSWENGIPVFVINPNKCFEYDVWLNYHTEKIFWDLDVCIDYVYNLEK